MKLKILDLNLWMLPSFLSSDHKKRLQGFIQLVKKTNPDIITLQEVWLRKYIAFIRKNLRGYHTHHPGHKLFNKSGLLTLSKMKPSAWHFHRFPKLRGENRVEKLAGKGYLMIKLSFADRQFHIVNTHLYCESPRNKRKLTEQQFAMLKRLTVKGDWIVCGDLNLDESKFEKLNKKHFTHHTVKAFTVSAENKYTHSRLNRFGFRDLKLDYTLIRTEKNNIRLRTKVLQKPLVSDHYAVLTTFTFI